MIIINGALERVCAVEERSGVIDPSIGKNSNNHEKKERITNEKNSSQNRDVVIIIHYAFHSSLSLRLCGDCHCRQLLLLLGPVWFVHKIAKAHFPSDWLLVQQFQKVYRTIIIYD